MKKPGSPPSDAKLINVIPEGPDIYGTSYSTAKRHAKVSKTEKEERPKKNTKIMNEKEIIFAETNREDVQDPHHEGLVITLYIFNGFLKRIFVDGGT